MAGRVVALGGVEVDGTVSVDDEGVFGTMLETFEGTLVETLALGDGRQAEVSIGVERWRSRISRTDPTKRESWSRVVTLVVEEVVLSAPAELLSPFLSEEGGAEEEEGLESLESMEACWGEKALRRCTSDSFMGRLDGR